MHQYHKQHLLVQPWSTKLACISYCLVVQWRDKHTRLESTLWQEGKGPINQHRHLFCFDTQGYTSTIFSDECSMLGFDQLLFPHERDKNLYKSCILFTKFNSPPNLVRDKAIYSTRAGSILTSAGPAWDLRVQLGTRR